jgi:hypothetical protein
MGLYIDISKVPATFVQQNDFPMRAWLGTIGRTVIASKPDHHETMVYWQLGPWGEQAAVAYDAHENKRLAQSGVFEISFAVPTVTLREIVKF